MTSPHAEAPASGAEWNDTQLDDLGCRAIVDLFKTLSAPPLAELDGEYSAKVLDQGSRLNNALSQWTTTYNPLLRRRWLCKAFTPATETEGHGYNSFDQAGRTIRIYRMKTSIVPSRYDGQPVFLLDYGAYDSLLGKIHMADEVRKVRTGLYLGIGTFGFTPKARMRPLPFTLKGPIGSFVGSDRPEIKS